MKTFNLTKLAKGFRLHHANTDRNPANLTHWMPVPPPGLTVSQLEVLMREVDRRPYTPPLWLQMRPPTPKPLSQPATSALDRDPRDPLHWMPVPLPVISPEQINARAEAFGLN